MLNFIILMNFIHAEINLSKKEPHKDVAKDTAFVRTDILMYKTNIANTAKTLCLHEKRDQLSSIPCKVKPAE